MKNLISETVEKIKKQGITPEPRWKYLVKKYGIWLGFFVTIFLGAISFSIAFDALRQLDWDLYRFAHQNALSYSLKLLPYFWLVFIGMFLVLAFFDLRKTETGYRYGWLKISLASIGGIIAIGFIFSLINLGAGFNSVLTRNMPYYGQHMMMTKQSQWSNPTGGFLAGSIVTVSVDTLEIVDLGGQKWLILLDEKTLTRPMAKIAQNEMIKIIGRQKDQNTFQAIEIRPWMGQGMMNGNGKNMMRRN